MVRAASTSSSSMARPRREPPPPGLSAEDLALWRHVTRADTPLPGRGEEAPERPEELPRPRPTRAAPLAPLEPGRPAGLDKRSAQRLRRGQTAIEGCLDLHGHTQAEAHRMLNAFLAGQQATGRRCVLVITGKGERGEGVLRRTVPHWLAELPNRDRVLALEPAQPRHGGAGALYVLLRKAR